MTKSAAEIRQQIQKLEQRARELEAKEAIGVIARIREAVAHYRLTPDDIFGDAPNAAPATRKSPPEPAPVPMPAPVPSAAPAGTKEVRVSPYKGIKVAPVYKDKDGNTWTGRGSQPRWLKAAISGGKKLDDFRI